MAIRNAQAGIYSLLLIANPLIIPCFQVPSSRLWQVAGGAPNAERLGDRPSWLKGKGFYALSLVLLFPSRGLCQSPCSLFSDECHVIRSVDRRRPDELVPGARALTAREYVTLDRKNDQKPPVTAVG